MHDAPSTRRTLVSIIGLLLAVATLSPLTAPAQTPAATVEDGSNNVVFQSFIEGQLLAPGATGSGTIPTTGAGVRLMWHPNDAAIRAGEVTGTQWDDGNVADHSVAFGLDTQASGARSVAMGRNTIASGAYSTALGRNTEANDNYTTALGRQTTASNPRATAMGQGTTASARDATAMGRNTTASGPSSTAMGKGTAATKPQATAMGEYAEADHDHTFVWNDGSGASDASGNTSDRFSSGTSDGTSGVTGASTFHVKTTGGIRVITSGDNSNVTYIPGGSAGWSNTSTRTAKTNIDPVDPKAVLEGVRSLEVSTWEYTDGQGIRHIGPMAEDFHRAFDVGSSKKAINSINADGVALGAINGLAQKVETQKKRIADLEAENEKIKERLAALEAKVSADEPAVASLAGPWSLAVLLALGLGGLLGAGFLWHRRV